MITDTYSNNFSEYYMPDLSETDLGETCKILERLRKVSLEAERKAGIPYFDEIQENKYLLEDNVFVVNSILYVSPHVFTCLLFDQWITKLEKELYV